VSVEVKVEIEAEVVRSTKVTEEGRKEKEGEMAGRHKFLGA
jgi:hypothetical protein